MLKVVNPSIRAGLVLTSELIEPFFRRVSWTLLVVVKASSPF